MRLAFGLVSLVLVAAVGGCAIDLPHSPTPDRSASAKPLELTTTGTFSPYHDGATAVTYDPALVPPGAKATVVVKSVGANIVVTLTVSGLLANRTYGSHLHSKPCGAKADAAGPHLQHQPDPASAPSAPSVDPSYANPRNEVWLDFTTDGSGTATSTATHPWLPPLGTSRSVVIHAGATKTGPKEAGTAGPRVACLTVPA